MNGRSKDPYNLVNVIWGQNINVLMLKTLLRAFPPGYKCDMKNGSGLLAGLWWREGAKQELQTSSCLNRPGQPTVAFPPLPGSQEGSQGLLSLRASPSWYCYAFRTSS